jgi:tetratricopeptide (TPR) repeat protein
MTGKAWMAVVLVGLAAQPALANGRGESEFERANERHHARHWDEAAAGFIASYQAGYREQTSAYNAACALARAGRTDEAFQWLDKAYATGFDLAEYIDDDSDLASLRGDPRFAALEKRVLGGRPSRQAGQVGRLSERYQALRDAGDTRPERYEGLGRELLRAGGYSEAARAFTSAAVREDNPAKALYNAACARSLHGDTEAALTLLQRAVENGFADPAHLDQDEDLDNVRGLPRFREIRALAEELDVPAYPAQARDRDARSRRVWQDALPRIEAAVQRHPQLGQAWFNLGFARLALGQPDQATAPFARAAALKFRPAASSYNLACALALTGQRDAAFAALDRALAIGFEDAGLLRSDRDLDPLRGDPRFGKYTR